MSELADPARPHQGSVHRLGHAPRLVGVGALEHPVAVDVGVDERSHAALLQLGDRGQRLEPGVPGPSGRGHPSAPHVDRHGDALAVRRQRVGQRRRVLVRGRPDDHAGRPRLQGGVDVGRRAQPAPDLHRHVRLRADPPDRVEVARRAGPRAVQVDHVQRARAGLDPGQRGVERVVAVDGPRGEVALHEAHGLAVEDVDRRVEDHAATRAQIAAKFSSSRSPCVEDFSGWNCTPNSGSRATADTNVVPYSLRPSTSPGSAGTGAKVCTW